MTQTTAAGLVRDVRRWDLVALVINTVIGAGIFGLPSRVFAIAGPWSLVAYLACAFLIVLIVLCFAEVSSRFTETGGPYLYARSAFGSLVGFQIGWLMWLARLTAFAALCNLFVDYLAFFVPAAATSPWKAILITAIVVILTGINIIGVRTAALVINAFAIGKLVPLLLIVCVGVFFIDGDRLALTARPSYGAFSNAVLLLVFAFSGFETALIPAGEAKDPRRHLPFALFVGMTVVVLLYILIQAVSIGTLPDLATSQRPLSDAGRQFLGPLGASVIAAGALISVGGTMNAITLASPRLLFGMAEQGQLPALLASTHARYRTPHVSILVSSALMYGLTLSGSFISSLTISTIIRLVCYAVTCAALPMLRRRESEAPAGFTAPGGIALAAAALALTGWLLTNTPRAEMKSFGMLAVLGVVLYFAFRRRGAAAGRGGPPAADVPR